MGPVDFVLLSLPVICASVLSLLYFFASSRSLYDLVLAGRRSSVCCVTLTVVTSTIGPLAFFFYPVLIQNFGLKWVWFLAGYWLASTVSYIVFVPIYHKMKPLSIYRYITQRYKANGNYTSASAVRRLISLLAITMSMTYYVLVVHGTCVLVAPSFPGPVWAFMVLLQLFVSLQSLSGGAAVTFALSIVSFVMIVIAVASPLAILGLQGNFTRQIETAAAVALKDAFDLSVNPSDTVTGLSVFVGSFVWFCYSFFCDQSYAQAFNSLRSTNAVRGCHLLLLLIFTSMALAFGLLYILIFPKWEVCDFKDPLVYHKFLLELLNSHVGLKGCYLSAILGTALVFLGHSLMNISTLIYDDFIAPCAVDHHYIRGSEENATFLVICTVVSSIGLGLASVFLTTFVRVDFEIMLKALVLMGCFTGSTVALYLAGVLFPPSNAKGAVLGFLAGVVTLLCLCVWYANAGVFYEPCLPPTPPSVLTTLPPDSVTTRAWVPPKTTPAKAPTTTTSSSTSTTTTSVVSTTTTTSSTTTSPSAAYTEVSTSPSPVWFPNQTDSLIEILFLPNETETPFNISFSYQYLKQYGELKTAVRPLSPLYFAPISLAVTFVVCAVVSIATGGNNMYALDWNLLFVKSPMLLRSRRVVHRRIKTEKSERLLYFSPKESFRAGAAYLPETNYRNPRVASGVFSHESTL